MAHLAENDKFSHFWLFIMEIKHICYVLPPKGHSWGVIRSRNEGDCVKKTVKDPITQC